MDERYMGAVACLVVAFKLVTEVSTGSVVMSVLYPLAATVYVYAAYKLVMGGK